MRFLDKEIVQLGVEVNDAQEAIQVSGQLLAKEGLIDESYIQAMIRSYEENGPYMVLAPQVAMPHARPEDGAREASVAFVQLKQPVRFGHETNDPVDLVFALAATSSDEHIQVLQQISVLLGQMENREGLRQAERFEEVQKIINGGKE